MSLLLSEGHRDARRYPVAVAWSEANIVRQRNSARRYRDSVITQQVLGTLFSKKANKELQKVLREVANSD